MFKLNILDNDNNSLESLDLNSLLSKLESQESEFDDAVTDTEVDENLIKEAEEALEQLDHLTRIISNYGLDSKLLNVIDPKREMVGNNILPAIESSNSFNSNDIEIIQALEKLDGTAESFSDAIKTIQKRISNTFRIFGQVLTTHSHALLKLNKSLNSANVDSEELKKRKVNAYSFDSTKKILNVLKHVYKEMVDYELLRVLVYASQKLGKKLSDAKEPLHAVVKISDGLVDIYNNKDVKAVLGIRAAHNKDDIELDGGVKDWMVDYLDQKSPLMSISINIRNFLKRMSISIYRDKPTVIKEKISLEEHGWIPTKIIPINVEVARLIKQIEMSYNFSGGNSKFVRMVAELSKLRPEDMKYVDQSNDPEKKVYLTMQRQAIRNIGKLTNLAIGISRVNLTVVRQLAGSLKRISNELLLASK